MFNYAIALISEIRFDELNMESDGPTSLISRIHSSIPDGVFFAASMSSHKSTEIELVLIL